MVETGEISIAMPDRETTYRNHLLLERSRKFFNWTKGKTMSVITVIKRECDQCKTRAEESPNAEQDGWIHIEGTIAVNNGRIEGPCSFDFCTVWCVRDFVEGLARPVPAQTESPEIPQPAVPPSVSDDDIPY